MHYMQKRILWISLLITGVFFAFLLRSKPAEEAPRCPSNTTQAACWKNAITRTLASGGIDAALDLIAKFYDASPEFAAPCHDYTHVVGRAAYDQFAKAKTVPINERTAFCSFGFYHGFMETLLAKRGDIKEARVFCEYVDEKLKNKVNNARLACYHGIGHGSTDTHNPLYKSDERAVVKPALERCEAFAQTQEQLKMCATGIFDSIAIAYYNRANGMEMKLDDPLWLCREQPEKYKESCYLDMMTAISWLGNHQLEKSALYISKYVEPAYTAIAMQTLADDSVRFVIGKGDPVGYVEVCRKQREDLYMPCIRGLASGMMQFGKPGEEYKRALSFCQSNTLEASEQSACTDTVFSFAQQRYPKEKISSLCESNAREYKQYCESKIN